MSKFEPEFNKFSELNEFSIPDKCIGCPMQCETARDLIDLLEEKAMLRKAANQLIGDTGEVIDHLISEAVPEEFVADFQKDLRKDVAKDLGDADQRIDDVQSFSAGLSTVCDGVLRMRASKGETTYTAAICTSPKAYEQPTGESNHVPAHVKTSPSE